MKSKQSFYKPVLEVLENRELPGNLLSAVWALHLAEPRTNSAGQKNGAGQHEALPEASATAAVASILPKSTADKNHAGLRGIQQTTVLHRVLSESKLSVTDLLEKFEGGLVKLSLTDPASPPIRRLPPVEVALHNLSWSNEKGTSPRTESISPAAVQHPFLHQVLPDTSDNSVRTLTDFVTRVKQSDYGSSNKVTTASRLLQVTPLSPGGGGGGGTNDGFIHQYVIVNADNDNGSTFAAPYIPQTRDFSVHPIANEDDQERLILESDFDPLSMDATLEDYRVTVTRQANTGGDLAIWDTSTKQNLIPLGQWTTDFRRESPGPVTTYYLPDFHLEGGENPSTVEDNFTVTVEAIWFSPFAGWVYISYDPVKVSVTPVIKAFTFDQFDAPQFKNTTDGRAGMQADIRISATVVPPPAEKGVVNFTQFVNNVTNNLAGGWGIKYNTNPPAPRKAVPLPEPDPNNPGALSQPGPNFNYAFLDSDSMGIPFYDEDNEETPNSDGTITVKMSDGPYILADPPYLPTNAQLAEIWMTMYYQTYLMVGFDFDDVIGLPPAVVYPLAYQEWWFDYKATGYVTGLGVTVNNSTRGPVPFPQWVPTHVLGQNQTGPQNQRIERSFFNEAIAY